MNAQTKKRIESLRDQLREKPALICSNCGVHIHEAITGKYETQEGALCRRCFAKILGKEIETTPIRSLSPENIA